ncbi:hypothetical protein ACEQ8H_004205 [Pleosporales sp. CAS-2024a]
MIAIVIPLGVLLPQRFIKQLPISVLIPFYVEPIDDAWDRLGDAIVKHHDVQFTVVVNPNDGPGNSTWPAAAFIAAVQGISIYPNVQLLGYVNTLNGTMPNATVRTEIATYAAWSNVTKDLGLHGVYFDQTPAVDDGSGATRSYLHNISATVRDTQGWAHGRSGLVAHNARRVPAAELLHDSRPDIVVVFEGAYRDMPPQHALSAALASTHRGRQSFSMLVHSVPPDLGRGGLRRIIERVRRDVEWLYVTDVTDQMYTSYPTFWEQWLDVAW